MSVNNKAQMDLILQQISLHEGTDLHVFLNPCPAMPGYIWG